MTCAAQSMHRARRVESFPPLFLLGLRRLNSLRRPERQKAAKAPALGLNLVKFAWLVQQMNETRRAMELCWASIKSVQWPLSRTRGNCALRSVWFDFFLPKKENALPNPNDWGGRPRIQKEACFSSQRKISRHWHLYFSQAAFLARWQSRSNRRPGWWKTACQPCKATWGLVIPQPVCCSVSALVLVCLPLWTFV